jgi:hypothetical protein
MSLTRIANISDVIEVTKNLQSPTRDRVAVFVTCQRGASDPLFDAAEIDAACSGNVDVYVLPSTKLSYTFGEHLPEGAAVFGGAARVYPRGDAWVGSHLSSAPVTFAFTAAEAVLKLDAVIDNALAAHYRPAASAPESQPVVVLASRPRASVSSATAAIARATPVPSPALMVRPSPPTPAALTCAVLRPATPGIYAPPAPPAAPRPHSSHTVLPAVRSVDTFGPTLPKPEKRGALRDALTANAALRGQLAKANLDNALGDRSSDAENAELRRRIFDMTEVHREQLKTARRRKNENSVLTPAWEPALFATGEEAVRHAVYIAWTRRVYAGDKAAHSLPQFEVGSEFASSIESLDAGQQSKAFKCVVDVLTGLARDIVARRVHPLREGTGTEEASVARADGAICFRANIETSTASARRLHYFRNLDGSIELSRVVLHDDMMP